MLTIEKLKKFGADADKGLMRCVNNEGLYFRLIGMMVSEPSVAALGEALKAGDIDKAFEESHKLKGVLGNLALTPIYEPVSELCELCRNKTPGDYDKLYSIIVEKMDELSALINGTDEVAPSPKKKTVFDFSVKDRKGNGFSLSEYRGKVLLIVNTATGCGFTPHYDPLEAMYKDLHAKGFEILDFPSNQFAGQAPGTDDEIHDFCTIKFGTEFPQFAKIDVNGDNADPLFAFLATEKPFAGFGKGVKNVMLDKFAKMNNKKFGDKTYIAWNFTKFLIDRAGNVVARFEPTVDMKDVRKAVEELL